MDSGSIKSIFGIPLKTLSLIILLAFITLGLFIIALKDINKKPTALPTINSINTTSPQTVLTISQNPITISSSSGSFYDLDILMDTGTNQVNSVQLELSFDPNVLQDLDIQPGSFTNNAQVLIKNINASNGRISFAINPNPEQGLVSGSGIVATLSFSLSKSQKVATSTAIGVLPKTEVRAIGTSESVLKSSQGSTVNLAPLPAPSIIIEKAGTQSAR